jgi:flagellar assembly protein FliH
LSDASRQRLIRAVRLLPGTVRIGHGTLEEIAPGGESLDRTELGNQGTASEESALAKAEAEIRVLRSELRGKEAELARARESEAQIRANMDTLRSELEAEKGDFYDKALKDAEEQKNISAKEGHEEGFAGGYSEGLASAEAEVRAEYEGKFANALSMLSEVSTALFAAREELALAHMPQLVRLWEIMLKRLLQARMELDTEAAKRVLEYILKRVSDREKIIIYLNPADITVVETDRDDLMESIRGVKSLEILSDDHVDRGSCLVETNLGIYDARWRTQLEQISAEVQGLIMESMAGDDAYAAS